MVSLSLVTILEAPPNVAFFPEVLERCELLMLNIICDAFFAIDIFLNFSTGKNNIRKNG